jgi:hypothetical protein
MTTPSYRNPACVETILRGYVRGILDSGGFFSDASFVRDDALLPDFAGAPPEASGLAYAATDRACAMLARSAKVMIGV